MTPGTPVRVSGAKLFAGTVKAATDTTLIITRGLGQAVTLRRDPASTAPLQWRCAGLPVEVREDRRARPFRPSPEELQAQGEFAAEHPADITGDFRERLADLVEHSRTTLYIRTFDGIHWFINDADGKVVRPAAFDSEQAARDWCATYRPKAEVIIKRYDHA